MSEPQTNDGISDSFDSPASYFDLRPKSSPTIRGFDHLHGAISDFAEKQKEAKIKVVWRGVVDAEYGLHSSLYRSLLTEKGINPRDFSAEQKKPRYQFPSEDEMVAAEKKILTFARRDWRMDNLSAMEVFARIQHVGGPTRLIDVTMNPYIAAWFATQPSDSAPEPDARLFAIAVSRTSNEDRSTSEYKTFRLDETGGGWRPFWHKLEDNQREKENWGTGSQRQLWVPPHYDSRILAQHAGFIFDGVPLKHLHSKYQSSFRKPDNRYWKYNDLLASSSIFAKLASVDRKAQENQNQFSPTFSFRIESSAKAEIRRTLEERFGYSYHSLYPDVQGLSQFLTNYLKSQFPSRP